MSYTWSFFACEGQALKASMSHMHTKLGLRLNSAPCRTLLCRNNKTWKSKTKYIHIQIIIFIYFIAFASACPARAFSLPFRQHFRPQLCWETGTTPLALAKLSFSWRPKDRPPQTRDQGCRKLDVIREQINWTKLVHDCSPWPVVSSMSKETLSNKVNKG